jgi:RNA polymerase sigma-70 factor, ECF subfamily
MSVVPLRPPIPESDEDRLMALVPQIRRLLYRLCWSPSDLDDLTQEALIELAQALPRFEGRSKLSTYAHTIAIRVAYRWLEAQRERRREIELDVVAPPPDELDPETRAMAREALRRLYRCLERLPLDQRIAFLLCEIEGWSPAEAAQAEDVSAGTMRARLMRARREVERRLAGDPYLARLMGGRDVG